MLNRVDFMDIRNVFIAFVLTDCIQWLQKGPPCGFIIIWRSRQIASELNIIGMYEISGGGQAGPSPYQRLKHMLLGNRSVSI